AATKRWGASGVTSTSHRSAVKRPGRTRPRVIPRRRRTSGGTGTTTTTQKPRLTRSASNRPKVDKPLYERAAQKRKRRKQRRPLRRLRAAGTTNTEALASALLETEISS